MAEIVIDANVIVGHLYGAGAQHGRAEQLLDRLERVVLERQGAIDRFASCDSGFDSVEGFQRLS